jgi:hypothetical protein
VSAGAAELVRDAALLCGLGRRARTLAEQVAATFSAGPAEALSCLGGDSPVQFTVDLPHVPGLRFGLLLPAGEALEHALAVWMPAHAAAALVTLSSRARGVVAPDADRVGDWLFVAVGARGEPALSLHLELPNRQTTAWVRGLGERLGLREVHLPDALFAHARPAALRLKLHAGGLDRAYLHWLLHHRREPGAVLGAAGLSGWDQVEPLFAELLGRRVRMQSRRWLVSTALDATTPPALRLGTSGWVLLPEGPDKQRALYELTLRHGGDLDAVQTLHSLCRGTIGDRAAWRVGRAIELRHDAQGTRLRLFLVPRCAPVTGSQAPPGSGSATPR